MVYFFDTILIQKHPKVLKSIDFSEYLHFLLVSKTGIILIDSFSFLYFYVAKNRCKRLNLLPFFKRTLAKNDFQTTQGNNPTDTK